MFRRRNKRKTSDLKELAPDPRWQPRPTSGRDRPPDPENRMIDLEDVHLSFGDNTVLGGIWLEVDRGETLVVMGGSGQGKSTILRIILGLLEPDAGRVYVHGVNVSHASQRILDQVRRQIGMVFQGGALFDSLTVGDNLAFRLNEEKANLMPAELSGGMRKRVALARAIMGSPKIVLYDEPTTGLDPITAETITVLINKLRDRQSVASIVVTHDIGAALAVGDRFAMLKDGDIIFEGDAEEVLATDNPDVRSFMDARMAGA